MSVRAVLRLVALSVLLSLCAGEATQTSDSLSPGEFDYIAICGAGALALLPVPCSTLSMRWRVNVTQGVLGVYYMDLSQFQQHFSQANDTSYQPGFPYDAEHSCPRVEPGRPCEQDWFDGGDPDKVLVGLNLGAQGSGDLTFFGDYEASYSSSLASTVTKYAIIVGAAVGAVIVLCCLGCCCYRYRSRLSFGVAVNSDKDADKANNSSGVSHVKAASDYPSVAMTPITSLRSAPEPYAYPPPAYYGPTSPSPSTAAYYGPTSPSTVAYAGMASPPALPPRPAYPTAQHSGPSHPADPSDPSDPSDPWA